MSKNNFTRTNVDVQQMEVSAPSRSSFDLTKRDKFTLGLGRLIPLRSVNIMPNSTFKGSVNPELQMETFATPSAGPMRLDTHSFVVPARRVHNGYKKFQESAMSDTPQSLPSFNLNTLAGEVLSFYLASSNSNDSIRGVLARIQGAQPVPKPCDPFDVLKQFIIRSRVTIENAARSTTNNYGYLQDWLAVEAARLKSLENAHNNASFTEYMLGDCLYDILMPTCGEGSMLDNLGYDAYTYFSQIRTDLNNADLNARSHAHTTQTAWTQEEFTAYTNYFNVKLNEVLSSKWSLTESKLTKYFDFPSQDELPLRSVYACWFDWFRNYHVEKSNVVLNPDDFGAAALISISSPIATILQLVVPHSRNWSRDMFTMVQPDDVYRHVYAPASNVDGSINQMSLDSSQEAFNFDDTYSALFQSINLPTPSSVSSYPFPSSMFTLFGNLNEDMGAFYHDLQTMRRANMLENYLRKNYFNSDTFAGQIEAHYGVKPSDFAILVSQYIGGSESMINGEQTISPSTTTGSDAGERTLVANAKSTDNFSYMCSDASYLINFASIVPIVSYDARNPFLSQLGVMDQPLPEYSNDPRIIIRTCDLVRGFGDKQDTMLGYVPRYYAYRHALDAVHGKYLREYRTYDWIRDRYNAGPQGYYNVSGSDNNMLAITAYSQHINIAPDCFLGLEPWDSVAFGKVEMPLFVECPLAGKVEFI